MVDILKSSGDSQKFMRKKIEDSVFRAGATRDFARDVSLRVESKVKDGMRTSQIQKIALKSIGSCPIVRYRYNLKDSIMGLGPSGYPFEEYMAAILRSHGYDCKTGVKVKGSVIFQEIDVVASRKSEKVMVEAKYHNSHGTRTNTKVGMYTYARFLDVKSNKRNGFTKGMLVTNTACTNNCVKYASGVGLEIIGWNYPKKNGLRDIIEEKNLYPITIFKIKKDDLIKLFNAKIVLARDLAELSVGEISAKTGINPSRVKRIVSQAREVCDI